jgi:hypothetical protein
LSEYLATTAASVNTSGSVTHSPSNGSAAQHSVSLGYNLPFSSIANPHGDASPSLMDKLSFVASGTYQTAINFPNTSAVLEVQNNLSYSVGVSFSATLDQIFRDCKP